MTQNERFTNRELSWLAFNKRVLSEAKDNHLPLMERLKFLSITASNLDEFFMVRVASLKDQVNAGYTKKDIAGMTSKEQIDAILKETHKFTTAQYNTYNRSFLPSLKKNGLKIVTEFEKLTEEQADYVDNYFQKEVFPVLTPMAVDSSRPFPLIRNRSLNIGALLMDKKKKGTIDFATVYLKGTQFGCTTNEKGIYHLKAPAGDYTLIVSAVGFETVERKVLQVEEKRPGVFLMRC